MKHIVATSIILLTASISACHGQKEVYSNNAGAIRGYDPVAYFTEEKPVKGMKEFAMEWKGATWYFSSQENLDLFRGEPEKYAPQYGGFCAYGIANGYKVKIDPEAWAVVDGKLYLNYDQKVQSQWNEDREGFIRKADKAWPDLIKEK